MQWIHLSLVSLFLTLHNVAFSQEEGITNVTTLYGTFEVREPLLLELMESPSFHRLEEIEQYGPLRYLLPIELYNRREHSLGVWALLKRYGASFEEEIAGLLHDVSHTVFSHVGDYLFSFAPDGDAYQNEIHGWHWQTSGLTAIMERHGYEAELFDPESERFTMLEQQLPDLCADRIEYNLQGGLKRGLLSREEFETILQDLRYSSPNWYFTTISSAKKLAELSLEMSEHLWGAPWSLLINQWTANLLKLALHKKLLNESDIHFGSDEEIWRRVQSSNDREIAEALQRLRSFASLHELCEEGEHDLQLLGKFRGVDPLIITDQGLQRLTHLDEEYRDKFHRCREVMKRGWFLRLMEKPSLESPCCDLILLESEDREQFEPQLCG